mmetsp:Transcript_54470/g.127074  ORF Transcript_54470/g.127074 Transcript_54470/m.127074 type:complete len:286 (-) Transcript_54470:1816-2673(-)
MQENLDQELTLGIRLLPHYEFLQKVDVLSVVFHICRKNACNHPFANHVVDLGAKVLEDVAVASTESSLKSPGAMMILQRREIVVAKRKLTASHNFKSIVVPAMITVVTKGSNHQGQTLRMGEMLHYVGLLRHFGSEVGRRHGMVEVVERHGSVLILYGLEEPQQHPVIDTHVVKDVQLPQRSHQEDKLVMRGQDPIVDLPLCDVHVRLCSQVPAAYRACFDLLHQSHHTSGRCKVQRGSNVTHELVHRVDTAKAGCLASFAVRSCCPGRHRLLCVELRNQHVFIL